jgi:hypothetical protein
MEAMLTEKEVAGALARMLKPGPIDSFPKRRADLIVLLALVSARFEAGRAYREDDVNDALVEWLEPFVLPDAIDHVTLRRVLVDEQFLLRNATGTAYRLNAPKLEATIDAAARKVDPGAVLADQRRQREERKRARRVES